MTGTRDETNTARDLLLRVLKPGDRVGTLTTGAGRVTRWVRVVIGGPDYNGNPGPTDITPWVARVAGHHYDPDRRSAGFSETGTDAEAGILLDLGRALWRDGWDCTGDGCPSAEHYGGPGSAPYRPGLRHHDTHALHHNRL